MEHPSGSARTSRPLAALALGGAGIGLVAMLAATGRGLDVADEGWYLLASSAPRDFIDQATPTQYQFVIGDLLSGFGGDVQAVRVVKLLGLLAAAVGFVVALLRWLPDLGVRPTVVDRLALGAVALVTPYGASWYPQTPGYNDLALLALLVLATSVIGAVRALRPERRRPLVALAWGIPGGAAVWLVVVSKFTTLGAVALLGLGLPAVAGWRMRRDLGRWGVLLAGHLVGLGVGMLAWQLRYASIADTLDGMWRSASNTGASNHDPLALLANNLTAVVIAVLLVLLAFATAGGPSAGRRPAVLGAFAVASVGAMAFAGVVAENSLKVVVAADLVMMLPALAVLACAPALRGWWADGRPRPAAPLVLLAAVLAAVQVFYALGTNIALFVVAAHACGFTLAGGYLLLRAMVPEAPALHAWCAALAVGAAAVVGVGITWVASYHQPPILEATVEIDPRSPLAGLRVHPNVARVVSDTIDALEPFGDRPVVLGIWGLQGLVYAAGGAAPGEIFEPSEQIPTIEVIERACEGDAPVLLLTDVEELPTWVVEAFEEHCPVTPADAELVAEVGSLGAESWTEAPDGELRLSLIAPGAVG